MKIAFFSDSCLPAINGVSYAVDSFGSRLGVKHQIEMYVPDYGETVKKTERKGNVVIRRYPSVSLPTYKEAVLVLPNVSKLVKSVEKFNPDIIHIHTPGALGLIGILIAKRTHKPIVGTYHTLISETLMYASPRMIFDKYIHAIDQAIEGLGIDIKLLRGGHKIRNTEKPETIPQKVVWSLVNRVYGYADVVLCPSEAIKRELLKRGMKTRVEVVSNGLDLKMFPCKKSYGVGLRMLHVGRLSFEKNVDVVIRAAVKVFEKVPEARLIIAGDGPATESLKKLVQELGVAKAVTFLGMVDRNSLSEVYCNSEVFVTASTMETQGLVALEAMSSALPLVAVNKYALADLVKHGRNGYLVKPGDTTAMAMGIIKLLLEIKVQEKMGLESRKIAETHAIGKIIDQLENLYIQVLCAKTKESWIVKLKKRLTSMFPNN